MPRIIELSRPQKTDGRSYYNWRKRYFDVGDKVTFHAARWPRLASKSARATIDGWSIVESGRVCYWIVVPVIGRLRCTLEDLLPPEKQLTKEIVIHGASKIRRAGDVRDRRSGAGATASRKAGKGDRTKRRQRRKA